MPFSKSTRERISFPITVLLIVGFLFTVWALYAKYQLTDNSVKTVSGRIEEYNFIDLDRGRYDYSIKLFSIDQQFKIRAILVSDFKKTLFEKSCNLNDTLNLTYISIPGFFTDSIDLISIEKNGELYLERSRSFERINGEYNFMLFVSFIFLSIGTISKYLIRR